MTRELGILTWDEAFLSLRSTLLPDALRAKYCELIIGQYVGHVIGHLVSVSK